MINRVVSLLALCAGLCVAGGPPAFPGAEGFGSATPGGRGGRTIAVTNLNDGGPGSLRAACEAKGPRIVVFRVGGPIDLRSPLTVTEPYLTLAGQSAPGHGVCLRGYGLAVATHDVVIRFLRSRPGEGAGAEVDAISVGGASRNVVLDHCSASWSVDEALSASGAVSDITVQWCLIAEALDRSVHKKGPHGYGSLMRAVGGVSLHHNLWAHNDARNPRLGDNYRRPPYPTFDFRHNVIYDFGKICSGMTGDFLSVNYVGNLVKPGPSSSRRGVIVFLDTAEARYYVEGNAIGDARLFDETEKNGRKLVTLVDAPFPAPPVTATPAANLFETVLRGVGASLPVRDAVDARIVEEARTGRGSVIDSTRQVGGWPAYRGGTAPADRDGDGMPDNWERAHRLNPRDPADGAALRPDGYSNVETYLNELATAAQPRDR
jgi:hypothetical protein